IQNLLLADHRVGNHHLWNSRIPWKVNIYVWRASINRLRTRANLASLGVDLDSANCLFCDNITEDLDHCVIKCPVVLPIWRKVWSWWDMVPPAVFPSFTILTLLEVPLTRLIIQGLERSDTAFFKQLYGRYGSGKIGL
nr:hypothetical protein [Tanacetum cinerariifolium]